MTHDDLMKLEDAASAAMAIRGDWERAYRTSKTQHNWRELTAATAYADIAMKRLGEARRLLAASERAAAQSARASRASMQPSLF
jgi:hypothetical protein